MLRRRDGLRAGDHRCVRLLHPRIRRSSECCTPTEPVAIGGASCCSPSESKTPELLARLAELVRRHDINDYAASVKVFAVKPR